MFLLVSVRHVGAHVGEHQHGVSIQISINWVKRFFGYLAYEIFLWPESWRGSLYLYLLSFPRFWTLSIERFWFLFWSILNGVTLKTSNMAYLWHPPPPHTHTHTRVALSDAVSTISLGKISWARYSRVGFQTGLVPGSLKTELES